MTDDELVASYLSQLRRAGRTLPRARRNELLDEIGTHIAEARAAGAMPLRDALSALGDPAEIAWAAGNARTGWAGRRSRPWCCCWPAGSFSWSAGSPASSCCGLRRAGAGRTSCSAR